MNNLSEKNLGASQCLYELVERQAILRPHAAAILAPGRAPLTYGRLLTHIGETASALSGAGLAGTVRVAVVLSDPAAQAVTMIAVASVATCVPFGSALTAREYRVGFSRTGVRAVVLESGSASPVRVAAESLGLQLLEASRSPEGESGVCLLAGGRDGGSPLGYSGPEDTAFVLQTSGTTGSPKVIPIGQAAICAGARLWVDRLQLSERDRCLNLMSPPTMGGICNLLPTLMAGASVIPGSGSWTPHFFRWLELFRPTWYAGSPPVHQAVLSLAATARPNAAPSGSLRFIRSGTAPLPPQVMLGLEARFLVPVIEAYGLSEVSPVSIKTGDLGFVDAEGYLFVTGRVKEIINRGGDKVSPREVDEVLLDHPAVGEAVAIAVPDDVYIEFGLEAFLSAATVGEMASIVTQVPAQADGGEEDSHG